MKIELSYFLQPTHHQWTYRAMLGVALLFFIWMSYGQPQALPTAPWAFTALANAGVTQVLLRNTMPVTFYIIGILLPLQHFADYLTNSRALVMIRIGKRQQHYGAYLLLVVVYNCCYVALVWLIVATFTQPLSGLTIGLPILLLSCLQLWVGLFSILDLTSIGYLLAILVVIALGSFVPDTRYQGHSVWLILIAIGGIVTAVSKHQYRLREVF